MTAPSMIYKKIADVMRDLDAVDKLQRNTQQSYSFRGIDDVYNALHPLLAKHGVFTVPEVLEDRTEDRVSQKGGVLIYRILKIQFYFFAEDGSCVNAIVVGEGMDSGDKASNKAMAAAHKYALVQVFAIPTKEAKDSENESHEVKPKATAKAPAPPPQKPAASPPSPPQRSPPSTQREFMPFPYSGPIGDDDEIYTGLPDQKKRLEIDARRAGITDVVSLQGIAMICKEHSLVMSQIPNAIEEWKVDNKSKGVAGK